MDGTDALLTIAEVAVAFAGFASVVTAFRRRDDGSWSPPDVVRFQLMIAASLSAVLFALLPFAFAFFDVAEAKIWSASSAILAAYLLLLSALVVRRAVRLTTMGALSPFVSWPFLAGDAAVLALLALNAAGAGPRPGLGPYFLGLLYLLILSGVSFARLMPIGRAGSA